MIAATVQPEKASNGAYRIAFQGEIGAYSQSAVYAFFGKETVEQVVPLPTFRKVFESLSLRDAEPREGKKKSVDYAVVPIENSLAGSVGETLDLLLLNSSTTTASSSSGGVMIVGEVSVPVRHALMIHGKTTIDKISKVISHPQAIAQCKLYLDSKDWEQIPVYDTAGAAKMIRDGGLRDTAAIASELAAEIYGLKITERSIEDDHTNQTRFVVIEQGEITDGAIVDRIAGKSYKTSLLFSTKHEPGSLVDALSALSTRGINLTRIESRPMKSRPWEYYFFVDFEGHIDDENCKEALAALKSATVELRILGSYARNS